MVNGKIHYTKINKGKSLVCIVRFIFRAYTVF